MNLYYIKNMVCNRCIEAVRKVFHENAIETRAMRLGEVETRVPLTGKQVSRLRDDLSAAGFELLDDSKKQLIEKIKNTVIEQVHYAEPDAKQNFSEILSRKLHKDYSYLSNFFSQVEGITIEKYIINQRIEKVKELLVYNELSLSEIAWQMGYSSVAYLSSQFKKVTGLTPTTFKQLAEKNRKPLDKI